MDAKVHVHTLLEEWLETQKAEIVKELEQIVRFFYRADPTLEPLARSIRMSASCMLRQQTHRNLLLNLALIYLEWESAVDACTQALGTLDAGEDRLRPYSYIDGPPGLCKFCESCCWRT